MDVASLANVTDVIVLEDMLKKLTTISALFQAIGGIVLAYIIFNIVSVIINRKKNKELERIRMLLEKINKKLDKQK